MTFLSTLSQWPVHNVAAACLSVGDAGRAAVVDAQGDTTRVFPLASVTKLLTSYSFLIACEEGVFERETQVPLPGGASASVAQLLSHASGVGFARGDRCKPPGSRRIYSSYGFEILADLLERETAISMPDYLREAVCEPLGMTSTELIGSAGHGAHSTVEDLSVFAGELLSPTLLSREMWEDYARVYYPDLIGVVPGYGMQKPCPWGLGCEIKGAKNPHWTGEAIPGDTFGHFGMSGTFLWVNRPAGRATVVLTDRDFGSWARPLWGEWNTGLWTDWPEDIQ